MQYLLGNKIPLKNIYDISSEDIEIKNNEIPSSDYLNDAASFLMKLNYNCSQEEKHGTGKGSCSDSEPSAESDLAFAIKSLTNKNQSNILQTPVDTKIKDVSKYIDALKLDMKNRHAYQKLVKQQQLLSKELVGKMEDLRRKFGYDPHTVDGIRSSMQDEKFLVEHSTLKGEYSKKDVRIDKQLEYHKLQLNESHVKMYTEFSKEHLIERSEVEQFTHGKVLTKLELSKYDDITISRDLRSSINTDELYFKLHRLPEKLRSSIKRIDVVEYDDPDNTRFASIIGDPNFKADGSAGNGNITFFNQSQISDRILVHEASHIMDVDGMYSNGYSDDWHNARIGDAKEAKTEFVTTYAAGYKGSSSEESEDFADGNALYFTNHASFRAKFPWRARVLDELYGQEMDARDQELIKHLKSSIGE